MGCRGLKHRTEAALAHSALLTNVGGGGEDAMEDEAWGAEDINIGQRLL